MTSLRDGLVSFLRGVLAELTRPAPLYFLVTHDPAFGDNMANKFQVRVLLPATIPSDNVTTRELSVALNGGTPTVVTLTPDVGSSDFFALEGDKADVSLVDVDQANNRSVARTGSLVVSDTVPPHQPGDLAITVVDQVPDDAPVPPAPPQAKKK